MTKSITAFLGEAANFAVYVGRRFQNDGASGIAASLSYTSLLSIVPLMAIALATLAAFPVFGDMRAELQSWVFQNFVPSVGRSVEEQVGNFVSNAGRLSAAGIVGLTVSAILLLATIETAFNTVFRVTRPRSALSRVLVYWTVMTLGPLLLGAALSLQSTLNALSPWHMSSAIISTLALPLPTVLTMAAFTILFVSIPNRQVRPHDALVGGVMAGLLFAALHYGFAFYLIHTDSYSTIYGAVAVVPIVLFWGFLSWVVVLIGAEITAALPEWRSGQGRGNGNGYPSAQRKLTLALDVLAVLFQAFQSGGKPVTRAALLARCAAPEGQFSLVLHRLQDASLIAVTTDHGIVLARHMGIMTLAELVKALDLVPALDSDFATHAHWRAKAEAPLIAAQALSKDAMSISLAEILTDGTK